MGICHRSYLHYGSYRQPSASVSRSPQGNPYCKFGSDGGIIENYTETPEFSPLDLGRRREATSIRNSVNLLI